MRVPRRSWIVTSLVAAILPLVCVSAAQAQAFLPPAGKIYAGVGGQPLSAYEQAVGKHPRRAAAR